MIKCLVLQVYDYIDKMSGVPVPFFELLEKIPLVEGVILTSLL